MNIDDIALNILCSLISNPRRYDYISKLVESGELSQEEANLKNINKAYKIAESFINYGTQYKKS